MLRAAAQPRNHPVRMDLGPQIPGVVEFRDLGGKLGAFLIFDRKEQPQGVLVQSVAQKRRLARRLQRCLPRGRQAARATTCALEVTVADDRRSGIEPLA